MYGNRKNIIRIAGILAAAFAIGCGGAKGTGGGKSGGGGGGDDGKPVISKEAREDFDKVAAAYKEAAKAGWNEQSCNAIADKFKSVADDHDGMTEAMYNVGVVYRNCKMRDKAIAAFKATLAKHPQHQPSLTHLAVYDLEDGKETDAEAKLKEAILAGRNTMEAVPAYTVAATMQRDRAKKGDQEAWKKAQTNLRTALAIDSKYMPALYQLAMLYYDIAVELKKPSYLTLAMLVFGQAQKLDPEFAPIYHTLGLIDMEKNELVEANKAFELAFTKDPTMFEAYMSFGAINLNFRGYEAAKMAFEKAVALRPTDYDAHMGLGVAARGLGDFALARTEYNKCAEISPARTDYLFNLALLTMDYENDGTPAGFQKAQKAFEDFIAKATEVHKLDPDGPKGPRISLVEKAQKRIDTCKRAIVDIAEAEKEMAELKKLQEDQAKQQAEMEAQMKKAAELEKQEASGATAPASGEAVDEAAIDAELDAEAAAAEAKAKEEAAAKKAEDAAQGGAASDGVAPGGPTAGEAAEKAPEAGATGEKPKEEPKLE
jgi:tetratricopeptide (TPR) repeat protein